MYALSVSQRRSVQQARSSVLLDLADDPDRLADIKPQDRKITNAEIVAAYRTLNDLLFGYAEVDDHRDDIGVSVTS